MTIDQLTSLTEATPEVATSPGQLPTDSGPESPVAADTAPEPEPALALRSATDAGSVQPWSVPDLSTQELSTNEPATDTDTDGDRWAVWLTMSVSAADAAVVTAPAPA